MIDPKVLDEVAKNAKREYGKTFRKGSEYPVLDRIPFEQPEMRVCTGGGIPLGRISRFWGLESGGKSLNALLVVKWAQNINLYAEELLQHPSDKVKERGQSLLDKFPEGMECVWYDVEGSFDPVFARKLGVDLDRLNVFNDVRIEVVGEVLSNSLGGAHLHIIDSVSGAASVDELNSKITQWHRAIKARSWNKVLDHFEGNIDKLHNAILFIDQIRVNQQTGANQIGGGKKMLHAASMNVEFTRGSWLYKREEGWKDEAPQSSDSLSGTAEADGITFKAHVTKSKVGQPFRRAEMRFDLKESKFDTEFELAKCAVWFGIAKKSGSWYELSSGNKVQGINQLSEALREDIEFRQDVINSINSHVVNHP